MFVLCNSHCMNYITFFEPRLLLSEYLENCCCLGISCRDDVNIWKKKDRTKFRTFIHRCPISNCIKRGIWRLDKNRTFQSWPIRSPDSVTVKICKNFSEMECTCHLASQKYHLYKYRQSGIRLFVEQMIEFRVRIKTQRQCHKLI